MLVKSSCRCLSAVLILFCVAACAGPSPESDGEEIAQKMYVDSRLGFAIEYPGNWQRIKRDQVQNRVGWQSPRLENGLPVAMLRISAFPEERPSNLEEAIEDHLKNTRMTVIEQEPFKLSTAEVPSLFASTAQKESWFLFASGDGRWYLIEFSALPDRFDSYLPLFEEVAGSFAVLP